VCVCAFVRPDLGDIFVITPSKRGLYANSHMSPVRHTYKQGCVRVCSAVRFDAVLRVSCCVTWHHEAVSKISRSCCYSPRHFCWSIGSSQYKPVVSRYLFLLAIWPVVTPYRTLVSGQSLTGHWSLVTSLPSPLLVNIRIMVIVWRLRGMTSSVLDCVTQCLRSAAHLYEQFLQVQQIGFVTLGPLRCT